MNKLKLSVIIPCYNEENNLKRGVLGEVEAYFKKQKYPVEVIISDDGSTDGSLKLIKSFCLRSNTFQFIDNPHGGKAFAIKAGIEKARGELILFTDLDQSTPISEFEKFLPFFKKGFDVVIGSRGRERKGSPLIRLLASSFFRFFRKAILLPNIEDTQCGFKAFNNKIAKDLFSSLLIFKKIKDSKGWRVGAFDVELLFLAQKRRMRIAEVKVNWLNRDTSSSKKRKFAEESKEMLKEIIRVKLNDLRGRYN